MNILSSIRAQATLPAGWNHGKGHAPTDDTVSAAINLCLKLIRRGYGEAFLEDFPYANGKIEIVLEAAHEVSFIVEDEHAVRVRYYINEKYILIAEQVTINEAIEFIPQRECNSFAIYTSDTSEKNEVDISEETVFWTMTAAEFPWSNSIVHVESRPSHVPMPENSIVKSPPLHQHYLSSSPSMNFQSTLPLFTPQQRIDATTTSRELTRKRQTRLFERSRIVPWDGYKLAEKMDLSRSL